jgi:hypothetical protein
VKFTGLPGQPQSLSTAQNFQPIFIVGCERSGTTLLAVLMGRHSRLAITPETQYMSKVFPRRSWNRHPRLSHEDFIERHWTMTRIADLQLDRASLTRRFQKMTPTYMDFFRALLEEFAVREGKPLIGEKSPVHLRYVPQILKWFPEARIICIVRDGRDVVQSLMKMPWTEGQTLRRQCTKWVKAARQATRFLRRYPRQFQLIKYEDLAREPEKIIRKIDEFARLPFEPGQLSTQVQTHVVPEWEIGWKARAMEGIDTSRIGLWKKEMSHEDQLIMNTMMRRELVKMGYPPDPPPHTFAQGFRVRFTNEVYLSGMYRLWYNVMVRYTPSERAKRTPKF